ncbi:MAG: hypothetical protein WBG50_20930 [Desulfomonilaceae bacterium]
MEEINWVQVIPALIGGGAAGAIINAAVSAYRDRLQPIGLRIEILPVFKHSSSESPLTAKIAASFDGITSTFNNLFLVDVQVVNRGNRDIAEFKFGATLSEGDTCIFVEPFPPDRHHVLRQVMPPTPQVPRNEIDFELEPFNRRDIYSLKLYIVVPEAKVEPSKIELSSPSPIRFIDMPTAREVLLKATTASYPILRVWIR